MDGDIESKEMSEINLEINSSSKSFSSELIKIKRSSQSPETKLALLDILMKDFLSKKFHVKKNLEYSDLVSYFLEKNKPGIAVFCHQMIKQLYGGEELNNAALEVILDEAREMIEKESGKGKIEKITSGFLNSLMGKKEPPESNENNVSKSTEKFIEKKLMPEGLIKVEGLKEENRNMAEFEEKIKDAAEVRVKDGPELNSLTESSDAESIHNIDDLDRIKQKIAYRKMEVARLKSEEKSD